MTARGAVSRQLAVPVITAILPAVILVTPVITAIGCDNWGVGNPEEQRPPP